MPEVQGSSVLLLAEETARYFDANGRLRGALEVSSCPVCLGARLRLEFVQHGFRYVRCRDCRFLFVNPRLDDAGSAAFYNSPFYEALLATEYHRVRAFGDTYHSSSTEPDLLEATAEAIAGLVPATARVVDLGCGGGALLRLLADRYGFRNAIGVDYSAKAVAFALTVRKVDVLEGDAKEVLAGESCDLVASIESIEHMNDLAAYLTTIRDLVRPGGWLVITTPRNSRLAKLLFGRLGDNYMAPSHLNYFNDRNLSRLLTRFGFTVTRVRRFFRRRGAGLLYRRLFARSEYVAYVPPVTGPAFAAIPRGFTGDDRAYIRDHFAFVAERAYDLDGRHWRRGGVIAPLRWLASAIAIPVRAHMLLVAQRGES